MNRKYLIPAAICLLLVFGLVYYYLFTSFSVKDKIEYVYVDQDDNIDSICSKLAPLASRHSMFGFNTVVRHSSFSENIHTGRYAISPDESTYTVFRNLKNGIQTPLNLTVPSVRTLDRLSKEIGSKLMMDSASLMKALSDPAVCEKYGYDTTTIACMFMALAAPARARKSGRDPHDNQYNTSIINIQQNLLTLYLKPLIYHG